MNAGAHGGETKDVLVEARGFDRAGEPVRFDNAEMGFSYRHSEAPEDVIFTRAVFQGRPGDARRRSKRRWSASRPREKPRSRSAKRPAARRSRTRRARKAWQLIDAAGCRGLVVGDAEVSTMHCNFLINRGAATAADIEALGEEVRRRVRETSGVELEWEIKRIGEAT